MSDNEDDHGEQIILAMEIRSQMVGFALLEQNEKTLKLLDRDYKLSSDFPFSQISFDNKFVDETDNELKSLLEIFVRSYKPSICIISSKVDQTSLKWLTEHCAHSDCQLELLRADYFESRISLKTMSDYLDERHNLLFTFLKEDDVNMKVTIAATGAILNYLIDESGETSMCRDALNQNTSESRVLLNFVEHIDYLPLVGRMVLDSDTISALNILPAPKFGTDNFIKTAKFSLFEMFGKNLPGASSQILTNWLLFPLTNKEEILYRLRAVGVLKAPINTPLCHQLRQLSGSYPNILILLKGIRNGNMNYKQWIRLHLFLNTYIDTQKILKMLFVEPTSQNPNILTDIMKDEKQDILQEALDFIESRIDMAMSTDVKSIVLRTGWDNELDTLRDTYRDIEVILNNSALEEEAKVKKYILKTSVENISIPKRFLNTLYMPQLGYLVSMQKTSRFASLLSNNPDWYFQFETATTIYFKTTCSRTLDDKYGDIYSFISDLEVEVLHEIQQELLKIEGALLNAYRNVGVIGVLCSFATVANDFDFVEPELCQEECCIDITNGRHPLYGTMVNNYIPNSLQINGGSYDDDTWKSHDKKRIAIITGANGSGKTVFLTQIGVIVYLAQIGSFVPADRAKISLKDRIMTKLRCRESLQIQESSFEQDVRQLCKMLTTSSERSLLLLDEFGKGTDVTYGSALFGSIIKHLNGMNGCPMVLATTHFGEIFKQAILGPVVHDVIFLKTDIQIVDSDSEEVTRDTLSSACAKKFVYLYTISEGISSDSFGILCARFCGIKSSIIERAQYFNQMFHKGKNIVKDLNTLDEKEVKLFANKQEVVKRFIDWDLILESTTSDHDLTEKVKRLLSESMPS